MKKKKKKEDYYLSCSVKKLMNMLNSYSLHCCVMDLDCKV